MKMSNKTFRCKKCGKFAEASKKPGHCYPCAAKYQKEYRAKKKAEKNGSVQRNTVSSSSNEVKLNILESSRSSEIPSEIFGRHIYSGIPQYSMMYPMNPYQNLVPVQNNQTDNEVIKALMLRMDLLEKKNEELEKEVAFLKQNSGIDPNVELDPHPYDDDYKPNLHPRALEMRICYNDMKHDDLVKNTINGLIFKSIDNNNNAIADMGDRLSELEKVQPLSVEILEQVKNLEHKLINVESQTKQQIDTQTRRFTFLDEDIRKIQDGLNISRKGYNWLAQVETGNERESIIIDLFNLVNDLIDICNQKLGAGIKYMSWPENYRSFKDLEIARKEAFVFINQSRSR